MSTFKKQKTSGGEWGSSSADDGGWGSSSTGDDGWGSSSAGNSKQGSASTGNIKPAPSSTGNGGWGSSSTGDDGWGSSSAGNNNKKGTASTGNNNQGSSSTGNVGWGSSSTGDGGWGSSSASNNKQPSSSTGNVGWGSSSTGDGGWGSSSASNNKQPSSSTGDGGWGSSSASNNKQPSSSTGDGGWGSSSASNNKQPSSSTGDGGWGSSSASNNKQPSSSTGDGGWGSSSAGDGGWGDGGGNNSEENNRKNPRGDRPGGDRPRGDRSGGDNPGGDNPGGDQPEGDRPAPYRPEEIDLDEEAKFNDTEAGEHFDQYCGQAVTCVPPGVVEPITEFNDVIKSDLLLNHLKQAKYDKMTPIQKWAMPALLGGFDIIGCAQTGSGKTAAFILPVLQTLLDDSKNSTLPNNADQNLQEPSCLIIAPTRELARQLHTDALRWARDSVVKCMVIYGGIVTTHLKAQISKGCNLLVATPGRLKDFVNRNWIGFKNIKYIILDEGDRLIDDGFLTDIKEILSHESMPPQDQRQTLFFSATFKPETQKVARELMSQKFVFITVGRVGSTNSNITQEFAQVSRAEKKRVLKKILGEVPDDQKTIIFTQTKVAADMLAGYFTALNLSATSIHGDRHQQQREEAIRQFRRGERRFLISSPVGNRGLDLPKVYLVINYDLPNNIDEYVHRIGRTGRAGHPGKAISFYDQEKDTEIVNDLVALLKEANQEIPDYLTSSASTGDFAESSTGNGDGGWGDSAAAAPEADADGW